MKIDYEALLAKSEEARSLQDKIIKNQEATITNLTEINRKLKQDYEELLEIFSSLQIDYQEVVSMCKEQQALLNEFLVSPEE